LFEAEVEALLGAVEEVQVKAPSDDPARGGAPTACNTFFAFKAAVAASAFSLRWLSLRNLIVARLGGPGGISGEGVEARGALQ
jgi:hypothetical protein